MGVFAITAGAIRRGLSETLATVTLADRAAASLGYGEEPGELDIVGSPLALQLGLMDTKTETALEALPHRLAQISSLA